MPPSVCWRGAQEPVRLRRVPVAVICLDLHRDYIV